MGQYDEQLNRLRDYAEDYELAYHVIYLETLPSGGKVECSRKIECDSIEVSDGLVRFLNNQGHDLWGLQASDVVEYWEVSQI